MSIILGEGGTCHEESRYFGVRCRRHDGRQHPATRIGESEWQITIIDRDEEHHFQSGYLFIPFGVYSKNDVLKPKKEFIPQGVEFVVDEVVNIDKDQRRV